MSRCYGIALIALLVGMPVAVWAGQADATTVVTNTTATGDTQTHREKRRGGHARLGNVDAGHRKGSADEGATGTATSPSVEPTSVTTTETTGIE